MSLGCSTCTVFSKLSIDSESFNAFFTRALRAGTRPLPEAADALACPVDGTVSEAGRIEGGRLLQAKGRHYTLDALLADRGRVMVIALVVHVDEVIRRLSDRGRADDEAFVIRERLAIYTRDTEPVLEYYRRRASVTILDGNRPTDAVTEDIEAAVSTASGPSPRNS